MKKFLLMLAIIFAGNFFASNVQAEMKTYEGKDVAMLDFGENDSKIVEKVKNVAKMRAITAAREKAGVYLKSFSQILNGNLTDDEIFAVTNNISEILDVNFEKLRFTADEIHGRYKGKEGYLYKATVTVKIDDAEISKYLNRNSQEKEKIILQNKNLHRTIIEIDGEFENLRETVAQKTPEQIQAELQKIDSEISASEKISEGNKFAYQKNYSAAVEKYNEAVEINPDSNAAKKNLESVKEEILESSKAKKHYNLGLEYFNSKQYKKALKEFKAVIKIEPKFKKAHEYKELCEQKIKHKSISGFKMKKPKSKHFDWGDALVAAIIISGTLKK